MTSSKHFTHGIHFSEIVMERPFELDVLWDILTHLATLTSRGPVIWETRVKEGKVHYLLGTTKKSKGKVHGVFMAHNKVQFRDVVREKIRGSPEQLVEDTTYKTASPPFIRTNIKTAKKLKVTKNPLSLNTDTVKSMIRAVLSSMVTDREEELVVQLVLTASYAPRPVTEATSSSWIDSIMARTYKMPADQKKDIRDRASLYSFDAFIRVGSSSDDTYRIINTANAMKILESSGVHIGIANEKADNLNYPENFYNLSNLLMNPVRLSVKEAASFMLLPLGEEELPGSPSIHPRMLNPPRWYKEPASIFRAGMINKNDRTFAMSLEQTPRKLSISPRDALEHTMLRGPTGSGKSTAMLSLILSDIRAGRSVLVLDPKNDLITDVLARIPEDRWGDVVVLDPTDPSPVGLNPLNMGLSPALTSDIILSVFHELWQDAWGVRTQDILGASLNTLARIKGSNLLYLIPLLTDETFRKKMTSKVYDPIGLSNFWERYESLSARERNAEIAPVLNKLRNFTTRPALRNVLGQSKPKFNLNELFFGRKIVLVPLNKGTVGADTAKLLGSLVVGLTWAMALSRANIAKEKRHMVSIFIDELQDYLSLPTSFSDALAQARGLGVSYTVAHQHVAQLTPDIKAGLDTNCRNKIIFGLRSSDAKDMAAESDKLEPLDFMMLPRYEVYTTFSVNGKSVGWVRGKTLPPEPPTILPAELKARSMTRYGIDSTQTEEELKALFEKPKEEDPIVTDTPIGRKRKPNTADNND